MRFAEKKALGELKEFHKNTDLMNGLLKDWPCMLQLIQMKQLYRDGIFIRSLTNKMKIIDEMAFFRAIFLVNLNQNSTKIFKKLS